MNMMDGDIEVESEPGMGSQFIIRIPLYNSRVVTLEPRDGLQGKQCWLQLRNASLATFLSRLLHEHGMQVETMKVRRRLTTSLLAIMSSSRYRACVR